MGSELLFSNAVFIRKPIVSLKVTDVISHLFTFLKTNYFISFLKYAYFPWMQLKCDDDGNDDHDNDSDVR